MQIHLNIIVNSKINYILIFLIKIRFLQFFIFHNTRMESIRLDDIYKLVSLKFNVTDKNIMFYIYKMMMNYIIVNYTSLVFL